MKLRTFCSVYPVKKYRFTVDDMLCHAYQLISLFVASIYNIFLSRIYEKVKGMTLKVVGSNCGFQFNKISPVLLESGLGKTVCVKRKI